MIDYKREFFFSERLFDNRSQSETIVVHIGDT